MTMEIAKTCVLCQQQFSSREAPGAVCMDCVAEYTERSIRTCSTCGVSIEGLSAGRKRCAECISGNITSCLQFSTYVCYSCEKRYTPVRRKQLTCSNQCAQKLWKKENPRPEPWNDRRRANYHKRRALKRALPADDVRPLEVYERDQWICGICNEPVMQGTAWPDPLSPSLDHIRPLARGGHHVYENVQLAHLRCNVSKGARVEV